MILSGPQYMNLGMFSWVLTAIVPRSQYNLTKKIQSVDKLPWMLRLYTRGDDQKLLNQFQYVAKISRLLHWKMPPRKPCACTP